MDNLVNIANDTLETVLYRADGGYLTGDKMTIADLQIFYESVNILLYG